MNRVEIFATLLLISTTWVKSDAWESKGYAKESSAISSCGPREIYVKDGRYHCWSVSETILNEYERQFGLEAREKLNNVVGYENLINTIETNSFCEKEPNDLLLLIFPDDYEKYVAVGKVVQKLSGVSAHCGKMAIFGGRVITAHKVKDEIQKLLKEGICEKVKQDAANGSITRDSRRLQEIGRVLKKNDYCEHKKSFGQRVCDRVFSAWLVCAIARLFGADV